MTALSEDRIYAEYRDKVLSYLKGRADSADDAEDLCEDVFTRVFRALPRYDPEKASLSTWIYQITRFTLIDYLRAKRPGEPLCDDMTAPDDTEAEVIRRETLEALAEALKTLGTEERDVIILHYYKGLSLTEISNITGISYGMVKVKHKRALSALRARLEER